MSAQSTITFQILALALFLSLTWGAYLVYTIRDWHTIRAKRNQREIIRAFRRMVVAMCLWLLPFSLLFRTTMVQLGLGADVVGQIVFFSLVGTNVLGSLFAVVSLRYD